MRSLCCTLVLLFNAACATDRLFAPRENANGAGPTGRPAAVYALAAPAHGEVRVWSDGAERREQDGAESTVLQLGFELENTGSVPLALDLAGVRVSKLTTEGDRELPAPQRRPGVERVEAGPGSSARADLEFEVPDGVAPRDILGFEVHWTVTSGDQQLPQITPFQTFHPEADLRYDPWPWWGFGYGLHWYRCR